MLLRHCTLAKNLSAILNAGLLCRKSQGRLPVVWLHVRGKSPWAAIHTIRRHGGRIEETAVLEVQVPRRWLRKSKRGLWYAVRDIPPDRIKGLVNFRQLAASPVAAA
jgi:hypothetical protein